MMKMTGKEKAKRVKARRARTVREARGLLGPILPLLDSQPPRPEELMMPRRILVLRLRRKRKTLRGRPWSKAFLTLTPQAPRRNDPVWKVARLRLRCSRKMSDAT